MSLIGLPDQLAQIPFVAGLDQKSAAFASSPPTLDICQNIEFDEIGNARTRKPIGAFGTLNVIGGGLVTDTGPIRRVVPNGDELVCFTQTALYAWIPEANAWALRDTYLAVATDEADVFAVNGDQSACDRAELNGVAMFCFVSGTKLYLAASDKTSGAVIMAPTLVDITGHSADRARLVALQTKVLLVWFDTSNNHYRVLSIDPANVPGSLVLSTLLSTPGGSMDIVRIPGVDAAMFALGQSTTQYVLITITAALVLTSTTKARGGDTQIALAYAPSGGFLQIVRSSSSAATVIGDLLNATTLADVTINQAIGSYTSALVPSHVTCAYRSVQTGGAYRCYIFWTDGEVWAGYSTGPVTPIGFQSHVNWADTTGAIGVASVFVRDLGLATRAFNYNGSVYVVGYMAGNNIPLLGFAPAIPQALQNTLFLYRDDGKIVGKANADRSSGPQWLSTASLQSAVLPDVTFDGVSSFRWCATIRRSFAVQLVGTTYAGRAPCEVAFTFDDKRARRTVRVGKTLYVTGAQVMQYDGVRLTELGWSIYPWDVNAVLIATGGSMSNGTYAYKATYRHINAVGELDRSTTATTPIGTTGGAAGSATIYVKPTYYTLRPPLAPTIEVWRTPVNPTIDSPFYLVTSVDPAAVAPNAYAVNDPTVVAATITDVLDDLTIATHQADPETGTVLETIAPLGSSIIATNDTRIFLAGIVGLPNTVWYSKTRNDGEVVAFNDVLTIQVPIAGGDITALAFVAGSLVVFRETAIYIYAGTGLDNTGGGANFELVRTLPNVGAVSSEAVAVLDVGVMFKSDNGWQLLDLGFGVTYIGAPIVDFDSDTVNGMQVMPGQHQIRITTAQRMIVYDTLVKQWGEWTQILKGCAMWNSTFVGHDDAQVYSQRTDYAGINYGWDLEFSWWKPNDLQGRALVRGVQLLGEWEADHKVRVRIARNYEKSAGSWVYNTDVTATPPAASVGAPIQLKISPKLKRGQSFKFRFTALAPDGVSVPSTDTAKLTGIAIRFALEDGPFRGLSAAQKA